MVEKTTTKSDGQITGEVFVSKFALGNNGEVYVAVTLDSMETDVASSVFSSKTKEKPGRLKEQITTNCLKKCKTTE